ncbi:MAG: hypothetical protein R2991_08785 [Thermoanaerobaculia bacterium]
MRRGVGPFVALFFLAVQPAAAGPGIWAGGGPEGGEVARISTASHPGSPLYARTLTNGVWRLDPTSKRWRRANIGLPPLIGSLAVDDEGTTLYAASQTDATVWKSNDRGTSWEPTAGQPAGLVDIRGIATAHGDPQTVVVSGVGRVAKQIHGSTDGGRTWRLLSDSNPPVGELEADPFDPETLFLFSSSSVWRSEDGGTSWSHLPVTTTRSLFSIAGDVPGHLLAIVGSVRLLESHDAGQTWSLLSTLPVDEQSAASALAVDPVEPSRVAVDYWDQGTLLSNDGGKRWHRSGRLTRGFSRSLTFSHLGASPFLLAATTEGVQLLGAQGWRPFDSGLEARSPRLLKSFTLEEFSVLFEADWAMGPWRSEGEGGHWTAPRLPAGVVHRAMTDDGEGSLYLSRGVLYRSPDGGTTWRRVPSEIPVFSISAVAHSEPGILLVGGTTIEYGTAFALFRSFDGGRTGEPLFDPPGNGTVGFEPQEILWNDSRPTRILLGSWHFNHRGCVIDKSTDSGQTWTRVLDTDRLTYCNHLTLEDDPGDADLLYLIARPGAPQNQGNTEFDRLLRSEDGGDTWQDIGAGLPCYRSITVDPRSSDVFVGCSSVFVSHDRGDSWEPFDGTGFPSDVRFIGALEAKTGPQTTLCAGTNAGTYFYTLPN